MVSIKKGFSADGKLLHYAVGALVKKDDKYLLVDRATLPLGFACIAGHVDEGEDEKQALIREVKEETGLDVKEIKLIGNEIVEDNPCV